MRTCAPICSPASFFLREIVEVAGIKPGDPVRVSGKKGENAGVPQQFLVEKPAKDYGFCTVSPAVP
jgi:hypothetical protein